MRDLPRGKGKQRAAHKRPAKSAGRRGLGPWIKGLSRVASQRARPLQAGAWVECDGPSWVQEGSGGAWVQCDGPSWVQEGSGGAWVQCDGPSWVQEGSGGAWVQCDGPSWIEQAGSRSDGGVMVSRMSAVAALARARR
jgi:hypothetical protein